MNYTQLIFWLPYLALYFLSLNAVGQFAARYNRRREFELSRLAYQAVKLNASELYAYVTILFMVVVMVLFR